MPTVRHLPTIDTWLPRTRRLFLLWAMIVAVSLLSFYVHLLHQSVARGEQLRAEHCLSTSAASRGGLPCPG